jgi:hypothetical protein
MLTPNMKGKPGVLNVSMQVKNCTIRLCWLFYAGYEDQPAYQESTITCSFMM